MALEDHKGGIADLTMAIKIEPTSKTALVARGIAFMRLACRTDLDIRRHAV
jgi:hypothetical protein